MFPAACAAGQTLFAAENVRLAKFACAVSQREQIPEIAGTQAAERFRPPEQKKFASRDAGGRRGIRAARGSCFLSKCGNIRGAWERVKRFMRGGTAGGDVCGTWERGFFILKRNIRGVQGRGGVLAAGQLVVRQGKDIFCVTGQNFRAILPGLRPRQSHALPRRRRNPSAFGVGCLNAASPRKRGWCEYIYPCANAFCGGKACQPAVYALSGKVWHTYPCVNAVCDTYGP